VKSYVAHLTKKQQQNFASLPSCRYWACRAPKLLGEGGSPQQCSESTQSAPDFIQSGSLSAEL